MTGEEIKRNLVEFARKWSLYEGIKRAEAQTFLNELFAAYGQDRYEVGAHFEEPQAGRFLDLLWPRVCLVEMKRPSEATNLAKHRTQALDYWRDAAARWWVSLRIRAARGVTGFRLGWTARGRRRSTASAMRRRSARRSRRKQRRSRGGMTAVLRCAWARCPPRRRSRSRRRPTCGLPELMPGNETEAAGLLDAYLARATG